MGLVERRLMTAIQENELPAFTEEFKQICNAAIAVEVDWESFDSDVEALETLRLGHHGLGAIRQAFHQICRDDLGKADVQRSIRKIVIRNVGKSVEDSIKLQDGTLTINWNWNGGASPYEYMVSHLEEALP